MTDQPREWILEWKEFQGFNIWHVEGDPSSEQYEKVPVIEAGPVLEKIKRLEDENKLQQRELEALSVSVNTLSDMNKELESILEGR